MTNISEVEEIMVSEDKMTTIRVRKETHTRLTKLGSYNETMTEIIEKCIAAYEREQSSSRKSKK